MPSRKASENAQAKFVAPMLCLPVSKLPEGRAWSYELKFDGYRALGLKPEGRVHLFSRNGKNFNVRYPLVTMALDSLPDKTMIDGEIVAYDTHGRPSFNVLQNQISENPTLHFYAFDLLMLRGRDLKGEPLDNRRRLLRHEVTPRFADCLRYSETLKASPAELVDAIRQQGFERIIAKRRDSRYEPGKRSGAWQKMRVNQAQDFVIGGYTPAGTTFDAVLVGHYIGNDLKYVAKVRAGFTPALRNSLFQQFQQLEIAQCPFINLPETKKGRWGEGLTAADMAKCR